MAIETALAEAHASLAALCAAATDGETIIIRQSGREDVALISAAEVRSLQETVHLLRSPANAERLFRALDLALDRSEPPADRRKEMRSLLGRSVES